MLRCVTQGLFANAARYHMDGKYRSVRGDATLSIHPSSVLYAEAPPPYIVFNDVVLTSDNFMRDVSIVQPEYVFFFPWLSNFEQRVHVLLNCGGWRRWRGKLRKGKARKKKKKKTRSQNSPCPAVLFTDSPPSCLVFRWLSELAPHYYEFAAEMKTSTHPEKRPKLSTVLLERS